MRHQQPVHLLKPNTRFDHIIVFSGTESRGEPESDALSYALIERLYERSISISCAALWFLSFLFFLHLNENQLYFTYLENYLFPFFVYVFSWIPRCFHNAGALGINDTSVNLI